MFQEIIYAIQKDKYPFGKKMISTNTYAEYVVFIQSDQEQKLFQQKIRIFTSIKSQNIINLVRISKKEQSFHLFYNYYFLSLETWLKLNISQINVNSYREILFNSISKLFHLLTQNNIKVNVSFENIAFSSQNSVKIFINPQFQLVQEIRNLKFYYQNLKKQIDTKFVEYCNHQKRLFNLNITQLQSFRTVIPRNFIIRGNRLIFLDQKQQYLSNQINFIDKTNKIDKIKRQTFSTQNTSKKIFLSEENHFLNFQGVKLQQIDWNRRTQRSNKSVQTNICKSRPHNKLYQSQRIKQNHPMKVTITTHRQIEIQPVDQIKRKHKISKNKSLQKHISSQNKIVFQNSPQKIIQNEEQVFSPPKTNYNDQRRRFSDISGYLRITKCKVDNLFKKYQNYLQKKSLIEQDTQNPA